MYRDWHRARHPRGRADSAFGQADRVAALSPCGWVAGSTAGVKTRPWHAAADADRPDHVHQPAEGDRLILGRAVGQLIAIESDCLQGILDIRFCRRGVGRQILGCPSLFFQGLDWSRWYPRQQSPAAYRCSARSRDDTSLAWPAGADRRADCRDRCESGRARSTPGRATSGLRRLAQALRHGTGEVLLKARMMFENRQQLLTASEGTGPGESCL